MASATGVPHGLSHQASEDEPLLGRPGDVAQEDDQPIYHNLYTGTAIIAQAGIVLLVASIWAGIFLHKLILFSAHPILNSVGVLLVAEGILILQPTHTAAQKRQGTLWHFGLVNAGIDLLIAGLILVVYNKVSTKHAHFESPHAILGLITYIVIAIQAFVGFTQYFVPKLYGSVDKAKSIYKWHRISGYVVLALLLATVAAATQVGYNKNVLNIKLWAILLAAVLILVGIIPRIKKQKLGLVKADPQASGSFGN
ncbi:eukaryotic cytochrome b561-domain-containing protein [Calycina marina]|uniref:Eukaryotic cytochrome b561-domain-containing protein n=1 Tax=Calycina marina TaxID=1763456 RepID=A0A9P7Z3N7_9HELO|nr:eukaryotic cytochrome b561-domain-containing protein [Calycina marina]